MEKTAAKLQILALIRQRRERPLVNRLKDRPGQAQEQRCDVPGESDAVRRVIHAVTPATFVDANRSVCRPEVSQQDCELLVCQTERIAWHTLLI